MFSLCLPLLITACATTQQPLSLPEQPGSGHGLLYLYRPLALSNALQTPQLMLNGQAAAAVPNGEFITLPLSAGQQRLSLQLAQHNLPTVLDLQIAPQRLYFVRLQSELDFSAEQGWQRDFQLQQVTRATALEEMQPMLRKQHKPVDSETETEVDRADDNDSRFSIQKTQNPFAR
ncbi:MAG TPA: DUF2846 domain-containing protein [Gammaproteobacteria bacterium]